MKKTDKPRTEKRLRKTNKERRTVPNNKGTGRPTLKTPELCKEICDRLSQGETLTSIVQDTHMPSLMQVWAWRHADESFLNAYTRARELGAIVVADTVRDVANQDLSTHEAIGKARLQMQGAMWHSGRYNPQFADKPSQTQVNVGLQVVLPEAERVKLLERRDKALLAAQAAQKVNSASTKGNERDTSL
jgi:hypothetical protein